VGGLWGRRLAAAHMWGGEISEFSGFPYGIYTIPEISMVGYTEHQLTEQKIPYELGIARWVRQPAQAARTQP
jgi:NAD(P) transhydrogenase